MYSVAGSPTLIDVVWSSHRPLLRNLLLMIAGSLALLASAKLQIPFTPVPMTMQTFVVLVIGMAFGWRLGAATILLYLAEGALGWPVFAGTPERGVGLAYMMGPTGGYLVGFVLAAALMGYLATRGWDRSVYKTLAAMTLGTVVIFACGLLWLGAVVGWQQPLLAMGLIPFVPGELVKIALAAAVMPLTWRLLSRH